MGSLGTEQLTLVELIDCVDTLHVVPRGHGHVTSHMGVPVTSLLLCKRNTSRMSAQWRRRSLKVTVTQLSDYRVSDCQQDCSELLPT